MLRPEDRPMDDPDDFKLPSDTRNPMDLHFGLFNQWKQDVRRAKAGFIRRFGRRKWEKQIEPSVRDGIMGIFALKPTPERKWYVELVVFLGNERYCKTPLEPDELELTRDGVAGDVPAELKKLADVVTGEDD